MTQLSAMQLLSLGKVRYADLDDAPFVLKLLTNEMKLTFRINGIKDIHYLINNSIAAITQFNGQGDIIGFIAAREYPLIPAVYPGAWEHYVWTKYKAVELNARNTLFIHLLCWQPEYARDCVDKMLKSLFMHDPYVMHIAYLKTVRGCSQLTPGSSRAETSFRRMQATERGVPPDLLPVLYVADRKDVSPRLRVRRAVEEDNDDLVPILEQHSKRLRELYGEFYISELVSRHPESERTLLVCEHKELAVGVMVLNTVINFEALEDTYDLLPYAGFRHLDSDHCKQNLTDNVKSSSTSFITDSRQNSLCEDSIDKTKSDVTKVCEEEIKDVDTSVKLKIEDRISSSTSFSTVVYHNAFDDEEELDFDIVNIDPELLRLPLYIIPDEIKKIILDEKNRYTDEGSLGRNKESLRDVLRSVSAPMSVKKEPEPPVRYSGESNAFLLELFAMHHDHDERYGFDMLEVAFEMFPNKAYCLLCVPSHQAPFPLLEHFTLVTSLGTNTRLVNESLYVAHVNSIRGRLRVRRGQKADIEHLTDVLENAKQRERLMDMFENSIDSLTLEPFVILSENQPVGVAVLGPLENGTAIRIQYNLAPEPLRPLSDGIILAGVISPVIEPHSRWFLRELMRKTRYTTLFWMCKCFAKGQESPSRNLMSLAERMVPVKPCHTIPNMTGQRNLDVLFKDGASSPFALWIIERPLTSLPKVFVNNKIVVVGASRTGLSFIETLIMGQHSNYLTFTNITLVSEHGLPIVTEFLKAAETCIPREGRYSDEYLRRLPFLFYVDIMCAVVVKIDRKSKKIHLQDGTVMRYDELVLTCGLQFQHPEYLKESLDTAKLIAKGKPCNRMLMDNPNYRPDFVPTPPDLPENVMLINELYQANFSLKKLLKMTNDSKKKLLSAKNPVIVYGDCIEAYCCMAALLELGIMGSEIAFVESFPAEDPAAMRVNCFNDEIIDERVQESLEAIGIRIYRKCRLGGWNRKGRRIVSIRLMSSMHCITVPCFALFYYGMKAINIHSFNAINECGLVYDGGLVVSPEFETNDRSIRAAGTCTQYSRRLYSSKYLHRYYSSEDVGEALGRQLLRKVNPFISHNPHSNQDTASLFESYSSSVIQDTHHEASLTAYTRWQPVRKFESPILISGTFPGPLYYMKLRQPGQEVPWAVQQCLPNQGHTLVTDKDDNYFRVKLNVLHVIDAVTCLSRDPFSVDVMSQLYGKHEAFFNKLLIRYQMHQIDDFYDYFMQPWMAMMYQETFDELMNNINYHDVGRCTCVMPGETSLGRLSKPQFKDDEATQIGTFRMSVAQVVGPDLAKSPHPNPWIPTMCGHPSEIRETTLKLWKKAEGESIVLQHITDHVIVNAVSNPHYATPTRETPDSDEDQNL